MLFVSDTSEEFSAPNESWKHMLYYSRQHMYIFQAVETEMRNGLRNDTPGIPGAEQMNIPYDVK